MSVRTCDRCTAPRKAGGRCTRRTCKVGPMCWQHTRLLAGLAVKKSGLPGAGDGLYAHRAFPARSFVSKYTGERLTPAEVNARYPGDAVAPYVLQVGRNRFVDARATNSGPARYANDCRAPDRRARRCQGNNTQFRRNGDLATMSRPVRAGDELFVSYGREYWRQPRPNPKRSHNRVGSNPKRARAKA